MPSSDTRQQALRNKKKSWNSAYKSFSQRLKMFKDLINGRGNPKMGIEPTNIKDPFPQAIGSFLDMLAQEFQTLSSDADLIIDSQSGYSKTRRKKREKQPTQSAPSVPTPFQPAAENQIVEQLGRIAAQNAQFQKEASSRLSRFWQYFKSPFQGKESNRDRIQLLKAFATFYYSILDFENGILQISMKKMPKTLDSFQKMRYNFSYISDTINGLNERLANKSEKQQPTTSQNEQAKPAPGSQAISPPKPKPSQPEQKPKTLNLSNIEVQRQVVAEVKHHARLMEEAGLLHNEVEHLNKLVSQYENTKDFAEKYGISKRLYDLNKELLEHLTMEVQKKYGRVIQGHRLEDILKLINETKNASQLNGLIKEAHNPLTRFFRRQLVKMKPYNITASHRLEIDNILNKLKQMAKSAMNILEKEFNIDKLSKIATEISQALDEITRVFSIIHTLYRQQVYEHRQLRRGKDKQEHDPLTDFLMRRRLRKDLSKGLF